MNQVVKFIRIFYLHMESGCSLSLIMDGFILNGHYKL